MNAVDFHVGTSRALLPSATTVDQSDPAHRMVHLDIPLAAHPNDPHPSLHHGWRTARVRLLTNNSHPVEYRVIGQFLAMRQRENRSCPIQAAIHPRSDAQRDPGTQGLYLRDWLPRTADKGAEHAAAPCMPPTEIPAQIRLVRGQDTDEEVLDTPRFAGCPLRSNAAPAHFGLRSPQEFAEQGPARGE